MKKVACNIIKYYSNPLWFFFNVPMENIPNWKNLPEDLKINARKLLRE